jgi:hypothetical protein
MKKILFNFLSVHADSYSRKSKPTSDRQLQKTNQDTKKKQQDQ